MARRNIDYPRKYISLGGIALVLLLAVGCGGFDYSLQNLLRQHLGSNVEIITRVPALIAGNGDIVLHYTWKEEERAVGVVEVSRSPLGTWKLQQETPWKTWLSVSDKETLGYTLACTPPDGWCVLYGYVTVPAAEVDILFRNGTTTSVPVQSGAFIYQFISETPDSLPEKVVPGTN